MPANKRRTPVRLHEFDDYKHDSGPDRIIVVARNRDLARQKISPGLRRVEEFA